MQAVGAFGVYLLDFCLIGDCCLFMRKIFGLLGRNGFGYCTYRV